jgi:hypothetical protein
MKSLYNRFMNLIQRLQEMLLHAKRSDLWRKFIHYQVNTMLKRATLERKIMMKGKIKILLLLFIASLLLAGPTLGSDVYIYPNKGQSQKQQDKDKYECYNWAKKQTGFDPMAQPRATAPPPAQGAPEGGVVRGAGRGAVGGLAIGAIAGDAGKGAAIGAASGALIGGMRRRDQARRQEQEQEQWAANQSANYEHHRSDYNRAFGVCMEGRDYTVK